MSKDEEELMCILFASLISADNESLTEETKQEMIRRYEEARKSGEEIDWTYLLEPSKAKNDEKQRRKDLLEEYKRYA